MNGSLRQYAVYIPVGRWTLRQHRQRHSAHTSAALVGPVAWNRPPCAGYRYVVFVCRGWFLFSG